MKKAENKCNDIEKAIANAQGSLDVDGILVTEEETEVIKKYFQGERTEKEVLKIIKSGVLDRCYSSPTKKKE